MSEQGQPRKTLSFFQLAMINIIAVDSLRSLPISAEYGLALVFFYLVAAVFFFLPSILITAELATAYPTTGGIYIWVREAFGSKMGFLVIWFQWIYNVVWYPTAMAFIAASIAYLINPALVDDKLYLLVTTISLFWLITLLNCFGMRISSLFSTLGALFGTLIPMMLIITLGIVWLCLGKLIKTALSWYAFFPHIAELKNLAFLSAVIFSLIGMEMSAVHAGDVKNPKSAYPKALWVSGGIIFFSLVLASVAVAIVIPRSKLNLVTGLLQAFTVFFGAYHLKWLIPVIVLLIVVGSLSGVAAWIIGPSKGLAVAAEDGGLPKLFQFRNKQGTPIPMLILQGIIFTALCTVFLFIPTISGSYWLLSAMTAQLGLLVYVILFATALKLHYGKPHVKRSFRVPGGRAGMLLVTFVGIIGCLLAMAVGFLPPSQIQIGNMFKYESILISSIVLFSILPFLLYRRAGSQ